MRNVSLLCALSIICKVFKFSSAIQYSAHKIQRAPCVSYLECRPPKFLRTPTKRNRYCSECKRAVALGESLAVGFEGTHTPRFCSKVQREEVWLTINDHPKAGGLFSSSTRFKQERLDYNLLRFATFSPCWETQLLLLCENKLRQTAVRKIQVRCGPTKLPPRVHWTQSMPSGNHHEEHLWK